MKTEKPTTPDADKTIGQLVDEANGTTTEPKPKPTQEPPKNKGGRPKGSKNRKTKEPEKQAQPVTPSTPSTDDELAKLAAEYPAGKAAGPAPTPGAEAAAPAAEAPPTSPYMISGFMALVVIDAIFPAILSALLNRYGYETTKEQLQLTEKEHKDLEKVADEVVKLIQMNPIVLLALSLVGAYASKIPSKP